MVTQVVMPCRRANRRLVPSLQSFRIPALGDRKMGYIFAFRYYLLVTTWPSFVLEHLISALPWHPSMPLQLVLPPGLQENPICLPEGFCLLCHPDDYQSHDCGLCHPTMMITIALQNQFMSCKVSSSIIHSRKMHI